MVICLLLLKTNEFKREKIQNLVFERRILEHKDEIYKRGEKRIK